MTAHQGSVWIDRHALKKDEGMIIIVGPNTTDDPDSTKPTDIMQGI